MNDDDLSRLLRAVDESDEQVPPAFAEGLWNDLRVTLARSAPDPAQGLAESLVDAHDITPDSIDEPGEASKHPRLWLGRVAAAVLIVGALAGLVVLGRTTTDRSTDQTPATVPDPVTTMPSVLDDPAEACRRFEESAPLAELSRGSGGDDVAVFVDELDRAVDGLRIYLDDLDAATDTSAITSSDIAPLRRVLGGLEQARLEIGTGDLDRARRSVEVAVSQYVEAPSDWC